jgi:TonB family protein
MPAPISIGATRVRPPCNPHPVVRSFADAVAPLLLPLIAAFALAAAPQPPAEKSAQPTPVGGSVAGLINSKDYPAEAIRRNEQGAVAVLLKVDPTGSVSDCIVEESSKSAVLDDQTCRILRQRAKFTPARDAQGANVAGEWRGRIAWRLEDSTMLAADWMVRSIIRLERGKAPTCRRESDGAFKDVTSDPPPCPTDAASSMAGEALPEHGAVELVAEQRIALGQQPKLALGPGDELAASQLGRLEIDSGGKLSSCAVVETKGEFPPAFPGVCAMVQNKFVDASREELKAPLVAYLLLAAYRHFDTSSADPKVEGSSREP